MKILVAMSGGVDSSFAAAWLKQQGHEVLGVTMHLWTAQQRDGANACCGAASMADARAVAFAMGFSHYVLDYQAAFRRGVVDYFASEYLQGRTPNPCVACNDKVKFDPLLKAALGLGAEKLATGHYARLERREDGSWRLLRASDLSKDQTYFLYRLGQAQLSRLLFPLGELSKQEVRQRSAALGLPTACKPESMDICFVGAGGYGELVTQLCPEALHEGPLLTSCGKELGRHKGLAFYTVGQRRGLGLMSEKPLYVLRLDPKRNAVVVGTEEELFSDRCRLRDLSWVAGRIPEAPVRLSVKIRASHPGALATILPLQANEAELRFDAPQKALTPGQAAVFYAGEECLGGGVIYG